MDTTTRRMLAILAMTALTFSIATPPDRATAADPHPQSEAVAAIDNPLLTAQLPGSPDLLGGDLGLEPETPDRGSEVDRDPIGGSVGDLNPADTIPDPIDVFAEQDGFVEEPAVVISEDGTFGGPIGPVIGEEPAEFYSSGKWFKNGCWYSSLEFVMLHHGQPRQLEFAFDVASGQTFVTGKTSFRYEPGTRITFGRLMNRDKGNRDHSVEFSYMGMFDWTTRANFSAAQPGNAGFGIPGSLNTILGIASTTIDGFNNADQQSYVYGTDLDSFELNVRVRTRPERDRLVLQPDGRWVRHDAQSKIKSFLAGVRVISTEESFLYMSQGTVPVANQGEYHVVTHNDMVGIHFGAELIEKHTDWTWGLRGNIGGLVNFADRHSRIETVGGIAADTEDIENENMVFLASGSLFGAYYLRPNLALTVSYEMMYLQGLALAPENLGYDGANFAPFNIGGDALLHGMFLGVECGW